MPRIREDGSFEFVGEMPHTGETPKSLVPVGQHVLYRFYDSDDELLYVGITWNPFRRWAVHYRKAVWFGSAVRVTCVMFPKLWLALEAEVAAIHSEKPHFNLRSAR